MRRWRPTREAQREVKALLRARCRQCRLQARPVGDLRPHRRHACGQGRARCGARELSPAASRSPRRWPKRDPQNAVWQHDLSVSHDRIGEVLDKKGDREAALESFRKGLAIAKALALRDPDNVQWQWDLSASHDRIGDVADRAGQARGGARQLPPRHGDRRGAGQARSRPRRLAARPGGQLPQDRLAGGASSNPGEARELLEKGRAIIARLAGIAAHQAQWRSDLSKFDEVLRTLMSDLRGFRGRS